MARDKEKSVNPATKQLKQQKQKALKKGKAAVQAQRDERLSKRNPERLQRQVDDLKAQEEREGQLSSRDQRTLQDLEQEIGRIKKARERTGYSHGGDSTGKKPNFRPRDGDRVRGNRPQEDSSSESDASAREIPMPRDTPPPVPKKRKRNGDFIETDQRPERDEPEKKPEEPPKTIYESAPVIRNLQKEATAFVPSSVRGWDRTGNA